MESGKRIFDSTPGSDGSHETGNSLHETGNSIDQFCHIQKSDCQEHSLGWKCLQGFGGKTCMKGQLIQLDSSSLGQRPGWNVVNRVMKLLLNMGHYMSQELLGSQRELMNAISQLGMMWVGERSCSMLDWALSDG